MILFISLFLCVSAVLFFKGSAPENEVENHGQQQTDNDTGYNGKVKAPALPRKVDVSRKLSEERNLVDYQQHYADNGDNDTDDDEPEAHIESSVHCWRPS